MVMKSVEPHFHLGARKLLVSMLVAAGAAIAAQPASAVGGRGYTTLAHHAVAHAYANADIELHADIDFHPDAESHADSKPRAEFDNPDRLLQRQAHQRGGERSRRRLLQHLRAGH
jgi:hypothetical protein